MESLRRIFALSFVFVALAGLARAEEKAPAACACESCCAASAAKTQKDGETPKGCCCCGAQAAKPVEKVMPKPSYNRKS